MVRITEEDAKTKWCPFARQLDWDDNRAGGMPISANRHHDGSPSSRCLCIGSRCMAWQDAGRSSKRWNVLNDGVLEEWSWDPRTSKTGYANVKVVSESGDEPIGFCGLAGRP